MTKQQYFSALLERDFIRYVLLRKPRFSEREVSEKLHRALDTDRIYRQAEDAIQAITSRRLSLEMLKDAHGAFVTVLPDWLNPDFAVIIVEEYRKEISEKFSLGKNLHALLSEIEKLTWAQGVDDMAENLQTFLSKAKSAAELYKNMPRPELQVEELHRKYEAAKRVTLKERVMGCNDNDILLFRAALLAHTTELCKTAMYESMASLCDSIAQSPVLSRLITSFEIARHLAETELPVLEGIQPHDDWDNEYSSLVPVDFFKRNIEDIDAAMAFHMFLFQAFARNESSLIVSHHLSPEGELSIFTSPDFDGKSWTTADFTSLLPHT